MAGKLFARSRFARFSSDAWTHDGADRSSEGESPRRLRFGRATLENLQNDGAQRGFESRELTERPMRQFGGPQTVVQDARSNCSRQAGDVLISGKAGRNCFEANSCDVSAPGQEGRPSVAIETSTAFALRVRSLRKHKPPAVIEIDCRA